MASIIKSITNILTFTKMESVIDSEFDRILSKISMFFTHHCDPRMDCNMAFHLKQDKKAIVLEYSCLEARVYVYTHSHQGRETYNKCLGSCRPRSIKPFLLKCCRRSKRYSFDGLKDVIVNKNTKVHTSTQFCIIPIVIIL